MMRADLAVSSGLQMANGVFVRPYPLPAQVMIDDTGLDLWPGLIDLHGDAFERALAPRPGVMLPVEVALADIEAQLLAAGITTSYLAVTLSWESGLRSVETYRILRDALRARSSSRLPDLRLHVRFEAANMGALDLLLQDIHAGHVQMLSFNDHTPGIVKKLGDPVAVSKFVERTGKSYDHFCQAARQAALVTAEQSRLAQRLLAQAACKMGLPMASHDDSTVAERDYFRALGAYISEFPTTREVALAASLAGEPTIMGAPNVVRGGSHTGWHSAEALIKQQACSVLCSDYHYPSLLQAVYRLIHNHSATASEAIALVTQNAAQAAGLTDRGTFGLGQRADFILVEAGRVPKLQATIVQGRIAYMAPDFVSRLTMRP